MDRQLVVLPLHKYPKHVHDCCKILNDQWPRSMTARQHELSYSCDELPCSLVLVKKCNEVEEVIGHSKLGLVAGQTQCCCVKSVVISKPYRGQGLGKFLMQQTESYAISLGFQWCSLTTHDQQGFYEKLGYRECPPMCFLTSGKSSLTSHLLETFEISNSWNKSKDTKSVIENNSNHLLPSEESWPPLPPPLPPQSLNLHSNKSTVSVTWMKKNLKQN